MSRRGTSRIVGVFHHLQMTQFHDRIFTKLLTIILRTKLPIRIPIVPVSVPSLSLSLSLSHTHTHTTLVLSVSSPPLKHSSSSAVYIPKDSLCQFPSPLFLSLSHSTPLSPLPPFFLFLSLPHSLLSFSLSTPLSPLFFSLYPLTPLLFSFYPVSPLFFSFYPRL